MSTRNGLRELIDRWRKHPPEYGRRDFAYEDCAEELEAALAADAPEPCDGCEEQVPTVLVGEGPVNLCEVCIGKLLESWKKVADAPEQAVCKNCGRPLSEHRGDGRCPVLPTGALSKATEERAAPAPAAEAGPLEQGRCECHHDARMHYPNCHLCGCQQFKPLAARAVVGQGSDALRSLRELSEKWHKFAASTFPYGHRETGVERRAIEGASRQQAKECADELDAALAAFAPVSGKE